MLIVQFRELSPLAGSIREAALRNRNKKLPPTDADSAWEVIYRKATEMPGAFTQGLIIALPGFAPPYARGISCGLNTSWFHHPAGFGSLCREDTQAVETALAYTSFSNQNAPGKSLEAEREEEIDVRCFSILPFPLQTINPNSLLSN